MAIREYTTPLPFFRFNGRRPLKEDDLWWNMTFVGTEPLMEDNLLWMTTFDRRRPLIEDDLSWKTTFHGRQPLIEDTFLEMYAIFAFIPLLPFFTLCQVLPIQSFSSFFVCLISLFALKSATNHQFWMFISQLIW